MSAALLTGVLALDWSGRDVPAASPAPRPAASFSAATEPVRTQNHPVRSRAAEVVRRWDALRARAYARCDLAALRRLYVAGSAAADADEEVLRGYIGRGLRVTALEMQLLAVAVLDQARGRLSLRVTDRVHGGVAEGADGTRVALPRDEATTRVLRLRRTATGWRVAAVSRSEPRPVGR
ncbi:MAG: hypothetical protein AVDCRST_MAG72-2213 [uncultured Nocardioidaceae bacterium]|uniref:SnoaL-like domain-containing protein n=1 Tax=uncultured Nocardioidaceae bacterium TaxID=253824 RepID=A0A6J4ML09_9ACTN|nr:MAG: hypothetical protein AVDCRST_MAG72-2213 [uncultured Nocardioidaceae bacterium]